MVTPRPSEVREWMDKQIQAVKLQSEKLVVNDDGDTLSNLSHTTDKIHLLDEAVRFIAEYLDIPLYVRNRGEDKDDPYEIGFMYEGYFFFAIETEKEYHERGEVV